MAAKTGRIELLCRQLIQLQDLGYVAAGGNVRFPWSVAALARHAFAAVQQSKLCVRIGGELGRDVCVAGCANLRTDISIGWSSGCCGLRAHNGLPVIFACSAWRN